MLNNTKKLCDYRVLRLFCSCLSADWLLGTITRSAAIASYSAAALKNCKNRGLTANILLELSKNEQRKIGIIIDITC